MLVTQHVALVSVGTGVTCMWPCMGIVIPKGSCGIALKAPFDGVHCCMADAPHNGVQAFLLSACAVLPVCSVVLQNSNFDCDEVC
jgi:hypothetical protein